MVSAAGSDDDERGVHGGSTLQIDSRSPFTEDPSELELQPLRLRTDGGPHAESQGGLSAPLVRRNAAWA